MANPRYKERDQFTPSYANSFPPVIVEKPHLMIIKEIVEKALKQKMWLFHTKHKTWYSPEEYLDLNERITFDGGQDWKNIKIMDPQEGLDAAIEQMESIKIRRDAFEKKIIDYYKNKAK